MKIIHLILFLILINKINAQGLQGTILDKSESNKEQTLPGVNLYWQGTSQGITSDTQGKFNISFPAMLPANLIVSMVGYETDTISIDDSTKKEIKIYLKSTIQLKEIKITGRKSSTTNSLLTPINTEIISSKELQKAACCNLSESFTTNASVEVAFTDAVSGAKKIQMLGLDGVYTQILTENLPSIRGLSASYGLNFIPGTWIESIQVTKGTGSVVNGYESITGQINLEFLKHQEIQDKLFVNLYANGKSRLEANVNLAQKINDKWSSLLFLHASDAGMKNDINGDSFLDMPMARQFNFFNRWNFHNGKRLEGQYGIKGLIENRQGGQTSFNYDKDFGTANAYGLGVNTKLIDYFSKTGILFPGKPYKSIGIMTCGRLHNQSSFFGLKNYKGDQKSLYGNFIYQSIIVHSTHKFKVGGSYVLDNYNETYMDSLFSRTEFVPGVFGEYTYTNEEKASLVAGLRLDYHNLYGPMANPRVHYKYNLGQSSALRLAAGRGFRTPNIFVDNANVFASSRVINIKGLLLPEIAWNYGSSLTHKFYISGEEASLNIDFFRTDFVNQVVVDMEDIDRVKFYNLEGKSFSNSLQADFLFTPIKKLVVKCSYKWYDVKTTYSGNLLAKPFVPKDRVMFNMEWESLNELWKFDFTNNWYGISRLPNTSANPAAFQRPSRSQSYFILNSQATKVFDNFECYLGVENILNFTQPNAILAPDNPFGNHFDATMIWSSLEGRVIYLGIRYALKKK